MSRRTSPRVVLSAELLEERINPVSFSTDHDYWMGSNMLSVAIGDLNGDGYNDIAASSFTNGVEILLNDGTGEFVRGEVLPISAAYHVNLADLNSDGKLDLYVATEWHEHLYTALGKGDGTFHVAVGRPFTTEVRGADAADFNGDGKLDIVVADLDGAAVLINNGLPSLFGTPTFYHPSPAARSFDVAAGDFNGDGKADFALIQFTGQRVDVFLNNGNGTFGAPTHYANIVPNNGYEMLARDFNNDGILDLMARYQDTSYLGLYFGNGNGTFQSPVGVNTSLTRNGPMAAADFDLDGNLDLVVMRGNDGNEAVFLGNGTGGFSPPYVVIQSWAGGIAAGDLNNDGLPDIVTGHALSPGLVSISINTTPIEFAFDISAPPAVTAGDSFTVTVTARNGNGAIRTDYAGLVHFTISDIRAQVPADAHLTNGVGTFTFTLMTGGTQSITAADAALPNISATTDPIAVTRVAPPVVASFSPLGLYRTTGARGWRVLSTMSAERFVTSADGRVVVADFGGSGLWRRNAAGWSRLTPANVQGAAVSLDGRTVVADFGAGGLRRWTGASGWATIAVNNVESVSLSYDGKTVVADFGRGGLRRWVAGSGWRTLIRANPEQMAVDATGRIVVGDFGRGGLRRWNAATNTWLSLSGLNAQSVVLSADGSTVAADFGVNGLQRWTLSGGWLTLSPFNAESVSISYDGTTILADLGANGLRRWTQFGGWTTLTTANAEHALLSFDGQTVLADFGPDGQSLFDTGWTLLTPLNARFMTIS